MLGCSVFTLGHFAPWDSYDIEGAVADELAAHADRGPWRDVKTNVADILPGDAEDTTHPGPEALPDCNTGACDLPAPYELLVERRLDPRFAGYHMQIQRVDQRPDRPQGEVAYVVKDIFMTANGSWEMDGVDENGNTVPQWARNSYLTREFLEAGADHHLFGAVIGLDGKLSHSARIGFWSDGFARLGDPDYDGYVFVPTKPESGWANLPIAGGSSFAPDRGERGPWCWAPAGASEVVCGGGLPLNRHISTFVVWQAVPRAELDERLSAAAGDGIYPHALAHPLARRFAQTVAAYNLSVQPLPRATPASQPASALVVKDLFTARIDVDCAQGAPGSVPSWATEDYRIPSAAAARRPSAEACATLYGAVCDAEGRLLPTQEILFSADGLSGLAASTPTTYNARTNDQTGWAHHVVGPEGAYAPARGQAGDWSWAPRGAAEAVCGGGVPMGQQLAIFAVWQAVPLLLKPADPKQNTGEGSPVFTSVLNIGLLSRPDAAINRLRSLRRRQEITPHHNAHIHRRAGIQPVQAGQIRLNLQVGPHLVDQFFGHAIVDNQRAPIIVAVGIADRDDLPALRFEHVTRYARRRPARLCR